MTANPDRVRLRSPERAHPDRSPLRSGGARTTGSTDRTATRAVRTAYTICDDMLRDGREAARSHGGSMNDRQSPPPPPPSWPPPAAWMQMWQEWMRMWAGMVMPFGPGGAPPPWMSGGYGGWDRGGPAPQGQSVDLQVASPTPVRVSVDVYDASGDLALGPLEPLQAGGGPALTADLTRANGRLRLSLRVPPDQPAGTYGASITQWGRQIGHVEVQVLAAE